jgi:hypothetical protein
VIQTSPAHRAASNESYVAQHTKVLRNLRLRDTHLIHDVSDVRFAVKKEVEDLTSVFVGDRSKNVNRSG